jgi:hypothetical protein
MRKGLEKDRGLGIGNGNTTPPDLLIYEPQAPAPESPFASFVGIEVRQDTRLSEVETSG